MPSGKDLVAPVAQAATERTEELVMKNQNFTTTISVDQSPEEVFKAITNVRGWWSGGIEGDTGSLAAEFTVPNKRSQNLFLARKWSGMS